MKLDTTSSERLNILRFPLIVGVVFIHAYGSLVSFNETSSGANQIGFFSKFVQDLFSDGLARIAVPLFFMLSGYLFFISFKLSFKQLKSKFKSRVDTLIIPFIFWNIAIMLLLLMAQSIPATSAYFSGNRQAIASYGLYDFFNNLVGIHKEPIAYQFWFIRDLIVMVALSPLLAVILNHRALATALLVAVSALWLLSFWPVYIPSAAAFLFFYAGAYLGRFKIDLFSLDRHGKAISLVYLVVLIIDCLTKDQSYNSYLHNIGILLGITASLYWSKLAHGMDSMKALLIKLSSCGFFVFAIHEPLLTIVKKLSYKLLAPQSEVQITLLYFAVPVVVILMSIGIYQVLKALVPTPLRIISGGR